MQWSNAVPQVALDRITEHYGFVGTGLPMYKAAILPLLTCRVAPQRNRPWPGWSPGGRRCDSHSCNILAPSHPMAHLYAVSPLCILLSPSGSQCGWKSESRGQVIQKIIRIFFISFIFVLVALLKEIQWLHNNTCWPVEQKQDKQYRPRHSQTL